MSGVLVEVCVADAASLAAAMAGGADRVELCSALELGGLTPTPGLMEMAGAAPIAVRALIRPRSGDFVFGAGDVAAMIGDIAQARRAGLEGVVLGASRPDGSLDEDVLAQLVAASAGLKLTLHRAFDLVPHIVAAVELAVSMRFDTILTSGGAQTAIEGLAGLQLAHRAAAGRIKIMPGSGVTHGNVGAILARVPVGAVHSSCSVAVASKGEAAVRLGFAAASRRITDPDIVRALKIAVH